MWDGEVPEFVYRLRMNRQKKTNEMISTEGVSMWLCVTLNCKYKSRIQELLGSLKGIFGNYS